MRPARRRIERQEKVVHALIRVWWYLQQALSIAQAISMRMAAFRMERLQEEASATRI